MNAIAINIIVNNIASKAPHKMRIGLYRMAGLKNPDEIRKNVYIQNIKALALEKNVFINSFCKFFNGFDSTGEKGTIKIGTNVTIGYGVTIFTTTHIIGGGGQRADYNRIDYLPVEIGEGTWVCANCTILPGVKIGKGCVIAAGAVVVNDCDDNCMYGGNPACLIKKLRTDEERVDDAR